MRRFIFSLLLLLIAVPAMGATGIPIGIPFDIPFAVDGVSVDAKALVVETGRPAKTMVVFYVGPDGKLDSATYTLSRGIDPNPDPNPDPDPDPDPDPNPVVKPAGIYLIHETGDSTAAHAAVRHDKAWKDACTAHKVRWMLMDDESGENMFPQSVALARKQGLPAVVIVYQNFPPVVLAMPATPEEMTALVNKYGEGEK